MLWKLVNQLFLWAMASGSLFVSLRLNLHFFNGFPMVFPLKPPFSYGFPMVFPFKPPFSYGFPMVFPFKPPFSYGFPMVFLWFSHLNLHFPMVLHHQAVTSRLLASTTRASNDSEEFLEVPPGPQRLHCHRALLYLCGEKGTETRDAWLLFSENNGWRWFIF